MTAPLAPSLRVLLMQLPVPSSPALNMPLAAGYLKAYAYAQGLGALAAITILPRSIADRAGDARLVREIVARAPDVLGVSLYTWNSERSLAVVERARAQLPGLRVVVGGPEVQPDNLWVLEHPAVDVAVIGEGEQTFVELLRLWGGDRPERAGAPGHALEGVAVPGDRPERAGALAYSLDTVSGLAFRRGGALRLTAERVALDDLAAVPSPYLAGCLELPSGGMLLVEVSRWCPYSCSFCLYGRNMGPRLGSRYFDLERVLAEVAWGRERGARRVHFVEANLNLVPIFWPLVRALAELNADRRLTFYAELRGEHLTDEVVAALDAANVRVVEVGLQTANPAALRAAHRRTDLAKWAAGTRRLYGRAITVLLDVILGLPADDQAGVATTLAFLEREGLGPYDVFTLQVLPGTAVRREASQYGLVYQDRPPYDILATGRLSYAELRSLRRELRRGAGLDPDSVEGLPPPRCDALDGRSETADGLVERVADLDREGRWGDQPDVRIVDLAAHVDVLLPAGWGPPPGVLEQAPRPGERERPGPPAGSVPAQPADQVTATLAGWIEANPSTVFDLYLRCDEDPPEPAALRAWRESLPFRPGYLDRAAVYGGPSPDPPYRRGSPRLWLVLPWVAQADPGQYNGVAQVVWRYDAAPGEPLPLGAWRTAGGAGVWLRLDRATPADERAALLGQARAWAAVQGRLVWSADA